MRIVFMGTPEFSVPSLEALIGAGYEVVGAVTQPDRPVGRKGKLTPPPVEQTCLISSFQLLYMFGNSRLADKQFLRSLRKTQILRNRPEYL